MELTSDERRQLAATFGCKERELDAQIARYTAAAQEEYLRMILGQRVFTRGQDMREYRLFLLIKHVFGGLPTEQQISALFQTTTTQSRSLLRAVMSKYQYLLHDAIEQTLRDVLASAQEDPNVEGGRLITVDNENIIDALNRHIVALDGRLPQITRARGTVSTYEVAKASYERLRKDLGDARHG